MQNKFSLFERLATATNALQFDLIASFSQSRRVNEHHGQTPNAGGLFYRVPGSPRNSRDDGAVPPQQLVEETGFPSVRTPNDRGTNPAPENLSLLGSA